MFLYSPRNHAVTTRKRLADIFRRNQQGGKAAGLFITGRTPGNMKVETRQDTQQTYLGSMPSTQRCGFTRRRNLSNCLNTSFARTPTLAKQFLTTAWAAAALA